MTEIRKIRKDKKLREQISRERRTKISMTLATDAKERAYLEAEAKRAGYKRVSHYIHARILKREDIIDSILGEITVELGKIILRFSEMEKEGMMNNRDDVRNYWMKEIENVVLNWYEKWGND